MERARLLFEKLNQDFKTDSKTSSRLREIQSLVRKDHSTFVIAREECNVQLVIALMDDFEVVFQYDVVQSALSLLLTVFETPHTERRPQTTTMKCTKRVIRILLCRDSDADEEMSQVHALGRKMLSLLTKQLNLCSGQSIVNDLGEQMMKKYLVYCRKTFFPLEDSNDSETFWINATLSVSHSWSTGRICYHLRLSIAIARFDTDVLATALEPGNLKETFSLLKALADSKREDAEREEALRAVLEFLLCLVNLWMPSLKSKENMEAAWADQIGGLIEVLLQWQQEHEEKARSIAIVGDEVVVKVESLLSPASRHLILQRLGLESAMMFMLHCGSVAFSPGFSQRQQQPDRIRDWVKHLPIGDVLQWAFEVLANDRSVETRKQCVVFLGFLMDTDLNIYQKTLDAKHILERVWATALEPTVQLIMQFNSVGEDKLRTAGRKVLVECETFLSLSEKQRIFDYQSSQQIRDLFTIREFAARFECKRLAPWIDAALPKNRTWQTEQACRRLRLLGSLVPLSGSFLIAVLDPSTIQMILSIRISLESGDRGDMDQAIVSFFSVCLSELSESRPMSKDALVSTALFAGLARIVVWCGKDRQDEGKGKVRDTGYALLCGMGDGLNLSSWEDVSTRLDDDELKRFFHDAIEAVKSQQILSAVAKELKTDSAQFLILRLVFGWISDVSAVKPAHDHVTAASLIALRSLAKRMMTNLPPWTRNNHVEGYAKCASLWSSQALHKIGEMVISRRSVVEVHDAGLGLLAHLLKCHQFVSNKTVQTIARADNGSLVLELVCHAMEKFCSDCAIPAESQSWKAYVRILTSLWLHPGDGPMKVRGLEELAVVVRDNQGLRYPMAACLRFNYALYNVG